MSAEGVFSFVEPLFAVAWALPVIQASVICFNTLYLDIDFDFDFDFDYILVSIDESNSSLLKLYLWKSLTY